MSSVPALSTCANGFACPVAKIAGFYNASASNTTFGIGQTGDTSFTPFSNTIGALSTLTGSANWMFDTVTVQAQNGVAGEPHDVNLLNFDLLVISGVNESLLGGTMYPAQIGKPSLGAP